jgi:hypothetical protein
MQDASSENFVHLAPWATVVVTAHFVELVPLYLTEIVHIVAERLRAEVADTFLVHF